MAHPNKRVRITPGCFPESCIFKYIVSTVSKHLAKALQLKISQQATNKTSHTTTQF